MREGGERKNNGSGIPTGMTTESALEIGGKRGGRKKPW